MAAVGFFRSPTGTAVTWDENGAHTDTGQPYDGFQLPSAQPATSGFFSTNEADNALANRGTPSAYNQWSDLQPANYQEYLAKFNAGKGDVNNPLAAWLSAGATPYTEAEYAARNAQATASPNTWGGGDTAASAAAQAARVAALPTQSPAVQNHQLPPTQAAQGALSQLTSLVGSAQPQGPVSYGQNSGPLTQLNGPSSNRYEHIFRPDQQGPWMNFHSDGQPSGAPIEFHPQPRSSLYAASGSEPAQGALTQSGVQNGGTS